MKSAFLLILSVVMLAALLATGCGNSSVERVYDTKSNPHDFPQMALGLLENIESGKLDTYDAIAGSFGQLYVDNPELLDDKNWQEIVHRLADVFRRRANELVAQGVQHYAQAAGLYTLAYFARPKDVQLKHMSSLFSVWLQGVEDTSLAVYKDIKGKDNPQYQINRVRRLYFGNSLEREFAETYLVRQVLAPLVQRQPEEIAELSAPDRAFLSSLNLADFSVTDPPVQFLEPRCDLAAYRVETLANDSLLVELYFIPQEKTTGDYTVALAVPSAAGTGTAEPSAAPLSFAPEVASSQWVPGQVVAAWRVVPVTGPIDSLSVGLCETAGDRVKFAPIADCGEKLKKLPTAAGRPE
ncbi:MAG: hypothetical protein OEW00_01525 [candidate division Zixibacteria bacterium]|nr:hypothetical protein [candidate division Zixibacteria bacterium]